MDFLYVKSIHIVFVVSWFAALFYIVRLFIYAAEADARKEPERAIVTVQLLLMQRKLWYIIGWPAMAGTFIFGLWMIVLSPDYLKMGWMQLKLGTVLLLSIYHCYIQKILNSQQKKQFALSSFKLRLLNELATVFLVAIVFLAVLKSTTGLLYGVSGLLIFAILLMSAVFIYRKFRKSEK